MLLLDIRIPFVFCISFDLCYTNTLHPYQSSHVGGGVLQAKDNLKSPYIEIIKSMFLFNFLFFDAKLIIFNE
jgi:hypothetical protein